MTEISPMHFTGPPEYYTDATQVGMSLYGVTFTFGVQTDQPSDARAQAIVRMSPQHAFVFYQLLKNNLREYEQKVGKIALPQAVLDELHIEGEI